MLKPARFTLIFAIILSFSFSSDLFFSEYAEGSSNNKYIEIYNPTDQEVSLDGYAYPNVSNAPTTVGVHEYWNNFEVGAVVAPGDVYVVCHTSSDELILAECDETYTYMSNGDDGMCLAKGSQDSYECIDWIGDFNGDPGSAWDVCGLGDTKDNTLVRNPGVLVGNIWSVSSAAETCEWSVYDSNTWDYLGYHSIEEPFEGYVVNSGSYYYSPSILEIQVGETVEWINDGGFHDVVVTSGPDIFSLPACSGPCTIGSYTFSVPGTYEYICSIGAHAANGMIGTVVVNAAACDDIDNDSICDDVDDCVGVFDECGVCNGSGIPDGNCDCSGSVLDCAGDCGGTATVDEFGNCSGTYSVQFNLDLSNYFAEQMINYYNEGDAIFRIVTIDGEYSSSSANYWYAMQDNPVDSGIGQVFVVVENLLPGVTYGYNFNYSGYESNDNLADCAGGLYGNDRYITMPELDEVDGGSMINTEMVCWNSCEECSEDADILGCMDGTAFNYNPNATVDDQSCIYIPTEVANLFFSEYAEGSSNNKYLEIYNATDQDVDLSGYSLSSCSNGCDNGTSWDYADNVTFETGTIVSSGDVYVVCHGSADDSIQAECDQTFTYLSNGDDVFGLTQIETGSILDMIGTLGDDPGNGWDVCGTADATKDHTLVRKAGITAGNTGNWEASAGDADECEWVVLEQNDWTYLGSHPHDFSMAGCTDMTACNYDSGASSDDGSCLYLDCLGECGGSAVVDSCGNCEGNDSECTLIAWATVDMSLAEVGDAGMKARISTINGEYNPSEWFPMEDNMGDGTWSIGFEVAAGNTYGYNFNNSIGFGYESGSGLGDCASGSYGNDRFITIPLDAVPGSVIEVPEVCWESCEACPTDIPGCMDETAENYNPNATMDDESCIYGWPEVANLFFSEYAEGSSNNKYLEIYNSTDQDVDLSGYSLSSCSNGCNDGVNWDYADNVTFETGTIVSAGDVYVVCHGSADMLIQAECDQTFTYLSNGDDVFALTQIGSGVILDMIGTIGDDPGNGWDVAGISDATKDHTLVRKAEVTVGNGGYWEASAGDEDESEWVVFDQNTWVYLGSHPHNFDAAVPGCTNMGACNYNADATEDDGSCTYAEDNFDCDGNCLVEIDCVGTCGGEAVVDDCGVCNGNNETMDSCGICSGDSSVCIDECGVINGDGLSCSTVFNVDMNCAGVEFSVVSITGPSLGWPGSEDWNIMTDDDGDGIYSVTLYNLESPFEYKYIVDNWDGQEDLTDDMANGATCAPITDYSSYANRLMGLTGNGLTANDTYGSCLTCDEQLPQEEEYVVTFDIDGLDDCGFVSVTGSWDNFSGWGATTDNYMTINLANGDYEYVVLCVDTSLDGWWNDIWSNSTVVSPTLGGECDFINDDEYANFGFTVLDSDMVVSSCNESECSYNGDSNGDGLVNVTDVVLTVGLIINGNAFTAEQLCTSDLNQDGLINVTDIVFLVGMIINGTASNYNDDLIDVASEAIIKVDGNSLNITGIDGNISGVELTLSHDNNFKIELEDVDVSNLEFASTKKINSNTTKLIFIKNGIEKIAVTKGDYEITDAIVVSGNGNNAKEIHSNTMYIPTEFKLKSAYPNPFNPITTLEMEIPQTGFVSVKVFNLVGQEVASLVNTVVEATSSFQLQFDAANLASGIYIVRAEALGSVQTQKLMLLK